MNKVSNMLAETKMGEDTYTVYTSYTYISMRIYTFTSTKQKYHEVLQGSRRETCKLNEISTPKAKPNANLVRFDNEDKMRFENPRHSLIQI